VVRAHAELRPRALPALPPVSRAVAAQALAWMAALAGGADGIGGLAAQAVLAAVLGSTFGLPRWWIPINLAFAPGAALVSGWSIHSGFFLAAFLAMAGVYWSTFRTQVPLYLSGTAACRELSALLPANRSFRFLDAGCGIGTTLAWLSPRHLAGCFEGVELAPLPVALAWLRARLSGGLFSVRRVDLWTLSFGEYDVVYAFLSPVPMNALWSKVRAEMKPGSLFVSNTFLPDGPPPDLTIPLRGRGRALHAWRL
jgi:SAM-dependent methyltransferase